MFYATDILSMRRKGKFARVWLAATLSQRLFKQSINNKVLLSMRIDAICDEILRSLVSGDHQQWPRLSLYLSSQLMYGAVKLYSYQINLLESSLSAIQRELRPVNFGQNNKRKRPSYDDDINLDIDLPEGPPLTQLFKNIHLRSDVHLLPEANFETINKNAKAAAHVELSFGELTNEQFNILLGESASTLQNIDTILELNEPIRYPTDRANQRQASPALPIEEHDLGTTDHSKTVEDRSVPDLRDKPIKTPQKRESMMTDVDTPSKRRRRNLGPEFDASNEQPNDVPMDIPNNEIIDQPADVPFPQPIDAPVDAHIDPPMPIRPDDITAPDDNEIHLESLELLEAVARPRRRRARRLVIDEQTMLDSNELSRNIDNTTAHTVPPESNLSVPVRKRVIPAISLLKIPSTNYQPTFDRRLHSHRYSMWPADLIPAFENHTMGPFTAEDDNSTAEAIRAADSRVQQMPQEISSVLGNRMGMESSRNKTTDEPSASAINPPVMPEITENEIINEPTVENTGYADAANMTNEPESNVVPTDTNVDQANMNVDQADTNVPHADENVVQANIHEVQAETNIMNATATSDPATSENDSFLPSKLKIRNIVKKLSHDKTATPEAIVDLIHSPASSLRSELSLQCSFVKADLLALIEVLWQDLKGTATVTFATLAPPDSTRKLEAAVYFAILLELHRERKVKLAQSKPYGDIHIYETNRNRQAEQ